MQVFAGHTGFDSNIGDVREYSLGDPRVICRILSDYLYSNKLGSIVRELSANAVDAHRMSGKEDVPFEVRLPADSGSEKALFADRSSGFFSIRDYGPGLSEDDIYQLYTSYGASNKRNDQSQIGGFGIGSKSPFAYTKTFEVASWHGGRKRQYVCFLDSSNAPCVKKVSDEESAEPSGIQVRFAVPKDSDRDLLRAECEFQYAWYPLQPEGNYRAYHPKVIYENEWGFCIDKASISQIACMMPGGGRSYSYGECRAVVNNAVYSLKEVLETSRRYGYGNDYSKVPYIGCWTILKVNGADIDISASRESLAATKRTQNTVKEVYEKFAAQAAKDIWEKMHSDAEKSILEAFIKWRRFENSIMLSPQFLGEWWSRIGLQSEHWNFSSSSNMALDMVPLDGDCIWSILKSGIRGYEMNRSSSSPSGFSSLWKMTKVKSVEKDGGILKEEIVNLKNIVIARTSLEPEKFQWELDLRGAGSGKTVFALAFANRKASVASITASVRALALKIGLDDSGFIHVYAVTDEGIRKKIAEAYGNPDPSRIFVLAEAPAAECAPVRRTDSGRKGKIEVRTAESIGSSYSSSEFSGRLWDQSSIQWLSVSEIEEKIGSGSIPLVMHSRAVSESIPSSFKALMLLSGYACILDGINWIVMNETSYKKYVSLGGTPVQTEDAVKYALKIVREVCGIEPEDFLAWAWISSMEKTLHFKSYSEVCQFEAVVRERPAHPISAAYAVWSRVASAVGRKFSNSNAVAQIALNVIPSGLLAPDAAESLKQKMAESFRLSEMTEWLEKNPILNLLERRYSCRDEAGAIADVVKRYIVWE